MNKRLAVAVSGLALTLAACNRLDRPSQAVREGLSAPAANRQNKLQLLAVEEDRKLVKTVDLELRVRDSAAASASARTLATELGGYVSAMSSQRREGLLYSSITLRVPVATLDRAVDRLKALAEEVQREEMKSEDVTEQFVDLGARLKTLEATEVELRQLLAESRQRQQKADDIMAIYGKLTEIRSGIEQIKGQLQSMENLTTLATIHLQLVPAESGRPVVSDGWRPGETVRSSVRALLAVLRTIGDLVIGGVIVLGPLAAIVGAGVWIVLRLRRRARRENS